MTDEQLKELDDARRKREDELFLLLLLLIGWGLSQALVSLTRPGEAVTEPDVTGDGVDVSGIARLLRTQGVQEIAESMADAHLDSYEMSGATAVPDREALVRQYEPAAAEMVEAMVDTLAKAGGATLAESLTKVGYSRSNSTGIELGVERQIVTASNAGIIDGAFARLGRGGVTGLRHVSVIDDRTTAICKERDGLSLPPSDPYWLLNWPSLHWRCRSVVVPLTGNYRVSDWRPKHPPDVGFGRAPAVVRNLLRRLAA